MTKIRICSKGGLATALRVLHLFQPLSPPATVERTPDFLQATARQPSWPSCEQSNRSTGQANREMGLFTCTLHAISCPKFPQIFPEFCQGGDTGISSVVPGVSF